MVLLLYSIPPGESPPPPRICFGRDELIEEVVGLAKNLTPIALIGVGGIGKTSVALAVLHHDHIKQQFGDNRWFIHCDQFPASYTHFLSQLSRVIGAGVNNPGDLTSLCPFLSSREMILFLDNAESILDPQGANAQEIYAVVEELSQIKTVCLCITSRISTVPQQCKCPTIPTLSMESACSIFYGIYENGGRSNIISNLLRQLDFHALSITLLATAASHNMWDYNQLAQEWNTHHVQILWAGDNKSLATTIKLSLSSPTFRKLGPNAHDLLGVIAFFPQGIDENNLDWLFPTISDRKNIFNKFCILSLTYQSGGFITMLAPLRDYFCPKDPTSSSLLLMTKEHYFNRLSIHVGPGGPGFGSAQWIMSEDINVEHLLNIFMTINEESNDVWEVCHCFMQHLYWHKRRLVMLGPKIERLPNNHPSKPQCLFQLSQLFHSVGNEVEHKRLLTCTLKLWRERGNDLCVGDTLTFLSDANKQLGLYKEGICQVEEAVEIFEQLGIKSVQARAQLQLAWLLYSDNQLDVAEEAASQVIDLLLGEDDQLQICICHRLLGLIYRSKGERKKAINHFETALRIASPFNWHDEQFLVYHCLAQLFFDENRFSEAHSLIRLAKLHTANSIYNLGHTMLFQAHLWCKESKFEAAKSEVLHAVDIFEKYGGMKELEACREVLHDVEEGMRILAVSSELD